MLGEVAVNKLLPCDDNEVKQQAVKMCEVGYAAFAIVD